VCPKNLETFVEFICNITMLQNPRPGFSNHNVTLMISSLNGNGNYYLYSIFNTSTRSITARVDKEGIYNITAYENNYKMALSKEITVNQSNII
jgi:hypothetical protein